MRPSAFGMIVVSCWNDLPAHYTETKLDQFVVMPNHVHGIIVLEPQSDSSVVAGFKLSLTG